MAIKTFKGLIVWQKSMSIVEDIYLIYIILIVKVYIKKLKTKL